MAASSRFVLPRQQYIQANSVIGAGWKLYFYATGTSNPQDVFSDSGLTTPIVQPVPSDGSGNFPDIFLGANAYKVLLVAPTAGVGSPTYTSDPVQANTTANASTSTAGIIQIATVAQALAAASSLLAMTPVSTAAMIQQGGFGWGGNGGGVANADTFTLAPAITAYTSGMMFSGRAGFTNTGALTANVNVVGAVAVKKQGAAGPVALAVNDYIIGNAYIFLYSGADSCLYLFESQGSLVSAPGLPGANNLVITNNGASTTGISLKADNVIATSSGGIASPLSGALNLTIDCTIVGANGLDTGALAATAEYHVYFIYNPTTSTWAGLASLSSSAPTLPSGYTFSYRAGCMMTGGASTFLRTKQVDREVTFVVAVATTTAALPALISGGIVNTQTRTGATVVGTAGSGNAKVVPTTATRIAVLISNSGVANGAIAIAPNSDVGYTASAGAGANPALLSNFGGGSAQVSEAVITLEGTQIFYTSGSVAAGNCSAQVYGWTEKR